MRTELFVRFESLSDDGVDEIDIFDLAFNPIARLKDHPALVEAMVPQGVPDFESALRIAHAFTPGNASRTDAFSLAYIQRANVVLHSLRAALQADMEIDYSPTPEKLLAVLLEARERQISNIDPALALCQSALGFAADVAAGGEVPA